MHTISTIPLLAAVGFALLIQNPQSPKKSEDESGCNYILWFGMVICCLLGFGFLFIAASVLHAFARKPAGSTASHRHEIGHRPF